MGHLKTADELQAEARRIHALGGLVFLALPAEIPFCVRQQMPFFKRELIPITPAAK